MGIRRRVKDGKTQYGVSRRLSKNNLGMKRFRRWYEKRALANEVLDRLNGALATGTIDDVLPVLCGVDEEEYTLESFWARFRDEYCRPRLTSWQRYQQSFGFILPKLGRIPLREFGRRHLHEYLEQRIKVVQKSTANKDIAALKKLFSYALEVGAVEHHPLVKFATFRVQEKALRVPTLEEFRLLVDAMPTPELSALVAVLGETGMRISEARNLTWTNVDLQHKRITAEKTKGKRVRSLPLSDYAIEKLGHLVRYLRQPYVFVYQRGSKAGQRMLKPYGSYHAAAEKVGLRWVNFHTLRHMRATFWLQRGADIKSVKEALGHTSIMTTQRYLRHVESHADRVLREAQAEEQREVAVVSARDKSGTRG